ncbi:PH domain-containing protein [uncultured Pseudokineococcus sp.]|uniref:PH domain-containing protein n=1 Tax=uncultured Pseudokineococcus sp. TaxID=1642928 RepID=UPI00262B5629|nr:PH domain-containing protein [uncultured Pseudokineococcus sp.]
MPEPGSERARLHRDFAPRRARVVAVVIGALALLGGLVLAFVLPDIGPLDRLGFLGIGALVAAFMARQAMVAVHVDEQGLAVRNLFLSRRLEWAEVVEVRFGGGQPWLQLDLSDGDVLPVMAVQRADGAAAEAEAQRLATLVALHGPRDRG